ncbi:hypothetical protein DF3PA_140004 [Candidatus Defluviicoccus seviourii]|uniref:Uncharacterized protein n=1 Tax=Candidatus Defluviicoccus seviourii TaxID=2565273 RepID=A0A564WDL4_9PROT|nr:hypothetical protein DF3PA_140004 [Candidatus Defluviicoccus seviourii]
MPSSRARAKRSRDFAVFTSLDCFTRFKRVRNDESVVQATKASAIDCRGLTPSQPDRRHCEARAGQPAGGRRMAR